MDITTFLREKISSAIPQQFKNIAEIAEKAGVNQPNLNAFINGDRKSMKLETAWKLMELLGLSIQEESHGVIKRIAPYAPQEEVIGKDVVYIDVLREVGAGTEVELVEESQVTRIPVLPSYAGKNVYGYYVIGDSMEPTVKKFSYVGVDLGDKTLQEGQMYLFENSDGGMMIKRIKFDKRGKYMLCSDNKEYSPIDFNAMKKSGMKVTGRVSWVLLRT